ncbi:MAG: phage shock protein A [bacterium]|jgi:phage shock protein A
MSGFFNRLFRIGTAEAHSALDGMEDPVKMTEQGIRDLKEDLDQSLQSFAEVKAIEVRAKRDMEKSRVESSDWERKAMALLQKGESGQLDMAEAENLATQALGRKTESDKRIALSKQSFDSQSQIVQQLQGNIEKLKSTVSQYENELVTLKARAKTASATKKINKQLSSVDASGTVNMLERMKQKVEEEESLAVAYSDMAKTSESTDDKINKALLEDKSASSSESLTALRAKMGIK